MKKHLHSSVGICYISVVMFHFDQFLSNSTFLLCALCGIVLRSDLRLGSIGWATKNLVHTMVKITQLDTTLPG